MVDENLEDVLYNVEENEALNWKNKGNEFYKQGAFTDALQCYDKAIDADPTFSDAWNNKGLVLTKLGRIDDAKKCLEHIAQLKRLKESTGSPIDISKSTKSDSIETKYPELAAILSLIFPGLGQVYNGNLRRGFIFLIGVAIGLVALVIPGIIVWAYGIYDAYKTASKMKTGIIPAQTANYFQMLIYIICCIVSLVIVVALISVAIFGSGLLSTTKAEPILDQSTSSTIVPTPITTHILTPIPTTIPTTIPPTVTSEVQTLVTTYRTPTPRATVSSSDSSHVGQCYVNGYYRKSGTYVSGYWRKC